MIVPVILSIDQSNMGKCGWAVSKGESLIDSECMDYQKEKSSRKRLVLFAQLLGELLKEHEPDYVILEMVRLFHGDKIGFPTIVMLSKLIGVALVVTPLSIPVYLVNTSSWKSVVLGKGNAPKEASIEYVQKCYHRTVNDDEADAICIGQYLWGQLRMGNGEIVTTKNILEMAK